MSLLKVLVFSRDDSLAACILESLGGRLEVFFRPGTLRTRDVGVVVAGDFWAIVLHNVGDGSAIASVLTGAGFTGSVVVPGPEDNDEDVVCCLAQLLAGMN